MNLAKMYLLLIGSLLSVHAFGKPLREREEKIYVESGNICIADNQLFLAVEDGYVPLSSVNQDDKGTYITVKLEFYCGICKQTYDMEKQYGTCPHHERRSR